jgi:hypothetical protein
VEQSPAVSTVNVTSLAVEAGATAAFAVENGGTSTTPPGEGEQDNICMADPRPTLDPQAAKVGVPAPRMTEIGSCTSAAHGRMTSPPTIATSTTSKRHRTRLGAHSR